MDGSETILQGLKGTGVAFASSDKRLQGQFYRALGLLCDCIRPSPLGAPMLIEGGPYRGCWLESTATIGAETLSRFCPDIARSTFETVARLARDDGLLPYKILPAEAGVSAGPSFRQIQMVTPLARSVWNHASLNREPDSFISLMYEAISANDAWLARYRDTRGSGGVEAFCTFDTGHDLSPRFWHIPDTTYLEDPACCDPDSPLLPFIAPDLTANAYCQRLYLARMARKLGRDVEAASWETKASRSLECLERDCWDPDDEFFYDLDREGRRVRVQSDVLLRVFACEVGDDERFARACRRYLLNTRKFFARFPFTSIALDDPRFDPASSYNSWGGATNTLSMLRAPHAFDVHGRQVELTLALGQALGAYSRMNRFGQCLSPYTGEEGYTEGYSPTLLGLLDAIERFVGIVPRPDGELWFTALPLPAGCGSRAAEASTAYARAIDGRLFELACDQHGATLFLDGEEHLSFPRGVRVSADREGRVLSVTGMVPRRVEGTLHISGLCGAERRLPFATSGNEKLMIEGNELIRGKNPGTIAPVF